MHISELDTPALVVDLDILDRNLSRMAEYAKSHDLRLRPHTKTHKSVTLAKRQLALGAAGLTVAKVGEAEVMAAAGPPELLVAFPVLGRGKLTRLMEIARRTAVTVALDSLQAGRQLSDAARAAQVEVGVLAEMDAGLGRVGVAPGEELVQLAQSLARLPRLRFEGIAFYPGHIKVLDEGGRKMFEAVAQTVESAVTALKRAGLEPRIVSGGSTPTWAGSHRIPGLNEIRPGSYVFNDRNTWQAGACTLEDCAATVIATVVSTARKGQAIIDGGSKTFSSDRLVVGSGDAGFGHVVGAPEIVFTKMNEEHGFLDVRRAGQEYSVGDRVRILMNHVCVVMNLHERVHGVRGEEVVESWTVDARGKLQ